MDHSIKLKIDEVLRERGQSLYWLAQTTGVSYTTLWRLTKERALGINFSTLEKMCVALECLPGDLLEIGTRSADARKAKTISGRSVRRTSSSL